MWRNRHHLQLSPLQSLGSSCLAKAALSLIDIRGALGVIIARVTLLRLGGPKESTGLSWPPPRPREGGGGSNPLIFPPLGRPASAVSCSLTPHWSTLLPSLQQGYLLSHVRINVALTHQEEFGRLCSTRINMINTPFSLMTFSASKHKQRGAQYGLWWAKRIKCTMGKL
jgi:hypothetical protein